MIETFSLVKMVSGWFTGKHWGKTLSFGMSMAFLVFVGFGVYRGYFKKPEPTQTTEQTAEKINNYYSNPKSTFGCSSTRYYHKKRPVNGVMAK